MLIYFISVYLFACLLTSCMLGQKKFKVFKPPLHLLSKSPELVTREQQVKRTQIFLMSVIRDPILGKKCFKESPPQGSWD